MSVIQITFSPTGGTARVAALLAAEWGAPGAAVDLTDAGLDPSQVRLRAEDLAILAVPSYGGRVPALAAARIAALDGGGARCVLACVYGNRAYEDTLLELHELAERVGFRVVATVAAVAEHSIVHPYAAGRPDWQDEAELRRFARIIRAQAEGAAAPALPLPGNRPYKQRGSGGGFAPKAGESCVACGLCAARCPAQAIDPGDVHLVDSEKCISCMRCVVQCPQRARSIEQARADAIAAALQKACSERKGNELYC